MCTMNIDQQCRSKKCRTNFCGTSSINKAFAVVQKYLVDNVLIIPLSHGSAILDQSTACVARICRCGYQIDSAARSTRGPRLTDDVSTLDVSTQDNGQNPEGLFINGA